MIAGMNLDRSKSTQTVEPEYELRSDRLKDESMSEMKDKKDRPYNRSFDSEEEFNGRVARKNRRKKSRIETNFYSWVIGVFSALIVIMVSWYLLRGWDVLPNSKPQWQSSEATSMIIESPGD